MSEIVKIGEHFIRQLDALGSKNPGVFYSVKDLENILLADVVQLPTDIKFGQFLEQLGLWDWIESDGNGFEAGDQSFRVTAKGQYRAAGSVDYVAQFNKAWDAIPIAPEENKLIAKGESGYNSPPLNYGQVIAVDSSTWTGLPKTGVLSDEGAEKLKNELMILNDALEKSDASNNEKSQARAYIIAINALTDAPEPPADVIWDLVSRLNQISGIASFIVSLIALFATVAK